MSETIQIDTTKRYHPFSNGSQFIDWEASNCHQCAKYTGDGVGDEIKCEIERAIFEAMWDEEGFDEQIARRMGFLENSDSYVWPCGERVHVDDTEGIEAWHRERDRDRLTLSLFPEEEAIP